MNTIDASKILDYLNSSIICLDSDLIINQVNATAEVFFDSSESALLNHHFASLFDPEFDNSILASLQYCLKHNHQITEHEANIRLINGKQQTSDYTIHSISDIDALSLLVEIRPVDRHLEIAREGQRAIQQVASQQLARGMAHEIKNPLGGIRGAAQLLEGEISNPLLKEYTDVIIRETDRLQLLLNNMLGPNRKINKQKINILQVLERVSSLILAEFSPHIQIIRDYDPSIPEILADKDQLIQAFLNITRNSAQAIDSNSGKITFKTRVVRQHTIAHKLNKHVIQIDIIDDGPGISDDVIENIFLPMVTNKAEGTGLGLPIAQQIIAGHQGIIQCDNSKEHTIFTTFLPLEPES
jgi:two-component system nitrogen regulation sensor histidine kinase GlnL